MDGIFHSTTYVFVVLGLYLFWHTAQRQHLYWSGRLTVGSALIGWGAFNVVESLVDHALLGIHHVNELVRRDQYLYWDMGFLLWGISMLVAGGWLFRSGRRQEAAARQVARVLD